MKKCTDRQAAFVEAYVVHQNATKAAVEAGYSPSTAAQQGARLLKNVKVRTKVDKLLARISREQKIRAEDVIRETKLIAFSNILDYIEFRSDGSPDYDLSSIDRNLGAAIKVFGHTETVNGSTRTTTMRIVLHDKLKALDKLDAATNAFSPRRDVVKNEKRPIINVISPIPGPPSSKIGEIDRDIDRAT